MNPVDEFVSGRIFHFVSFHLEDLGLGVCVLLSPSSLSPFLFTLPLNLWVRCGCVPCNFVGVVVVVLELDCGSLKSLLLLLYPVVL
jgi:hypothetical protein